MNLRITGMGKENIHGDLQIDSNVQVTNLLYQVFIFLFQLFHMFHSQSWSVNSVNGLEFASNTLSNFGLTYKFFQILIFISLRKYLHANSGNSCCNIYKIVYEFVNHANGKQKYLLEQYTLSHQPAV